MTEEIKQEIEPKINWMDVLEKAEKVNIELSEKLAKAEQLLNEQRELTARNLLGGKTDAGIQPQQTPEMSAKEYAQQMMKGKI